MAKAQRALHAKQFTTARATQAWWYRATNRVGAILPRFGELSSERVFAKVKKKHRELGDPAAEVVAALDALVESLHEDARLCFSGRIAAGMDCARLAEQHLRMARLFEAKPEIHDTELPAPIFMIGLMRSGSTYTHRLLARDPASRTLPYWESMFPVPPDGPDTRVADVDHVLDQLAALSPNYQAIHPMRGDEVEECVGLFTNVFRTLQFDCQYRAPGYVRWLMQEDATIAYRQYADMLRLVHHHRPVGARFVLKDPTHAMSIEAILEVFPGAKFIFTHRDPVVMLSSTASLYAYTRALFSDQVDPVEVGRDLFEGYLHPSYMHAIEVADGLEAGRVAHVRQRDVREDPVGAAESVYAQLGEPFTDEARLAMATWVDEERAGPRHVHEHSPECFGLAPDAVREKWARYRERFGVV